MATTNKKSKLIFLLILIAAAVLLFSSAKKETVGVDQVGVLLYLGGHTGVHQAGENVLVWPLISRLTVLTNKPVQFVMAGQGATVVERPGKENITLASQIRYQVDDPGKLIATHGPEAPQEKIENLVRKEVRNLAEQQIKTNPDFLLEVRSRILFVADTTHQLNQIMQESGVSVLSFELLSW